VIITKFITYPVRLSDVLRILISALAVCLKALALGPMSLASKVQALALRFWHWVHHWLLTTWRPYIAIHFQAKGQRSASRAVQLLLISVMLQWKQTCRSAEQTSIFSIFHWRTLSWLTAVWRQWRTHDSSFVVSCELTTCSCCASRILRTKLRLFRVCFFAAVWTLQATRRQFSCIHHVNNWSVGRHTGGVCGRDCLGNVCCNIIGDSCHVFTATTFNMFVQSTVKNYSLKTEVNQIYFTLTKPKVTKNCLTGVRSTNLA